jgi:hypothetical protein
MFFVSLIDVNIYKIDKTFMARKHFGVIILIISTGASNISAYAGDSFLKNSSLVFEPISVALFLTGAGILLFFGRIPREK